MVQHFDVIVDIIEKLKSYSHDYITCSKFTSKPRSCWIFWTFCYLNVLFMYWYSLKKNTIICIFKLRFASDICWSDVIMHQGYIEKKCEFFTTPKVLFNKFECFTYEMFYTKKSWAVTRCAEWFNSQKHSKLIFLIKKWWFYTHLN